MICGGNPNNSKEGSCMGDSGGENIIGLGQKYKFQNDIFVIFNKSISIIINISTT